MTDLARDFKIGARNLARSPGFAAAAVLSLALGIGLNTVIFSVLSAVLLQPLPVAEPERLVRVGQTVQGEGFFVVAHDEYREAANLDAFSGLLAHQVNAALLNLGEEPREVAMELVSANYFDVLRLELPWGRGFSPAEDVTPGTHPVLVISWRLWQERFAADPAAVGRGVRLNGRPFDVIGVAPEGFVGTFPGFQADIWVPLMMQAQALPNSGSLSDRQDRFLNLIGRLADGVTSERAAAELAALAEQTAAAFPDTNDGRGFAVAGAAGVHPMIATVAGPFLGLLLAVVALVLLIAAANVANLVLARAALRRRETNVRIALGAGRARLLREHLIEGLLLALPGAAGGVLVAVWGRDLVGWVRPPAGLPVGLGLDVSIDARVLAFSVGLGLALGATFGLIPALAAWRAGSVSPTAGNPAVGGARPGRMRGALIVSQVAVSALLLVVTGLLARSLINSADLDAGVDSDGVVVVAADPSVLGYGPERTRALWAQMVERAAELPQSEAAALGLFVPLGSRADQLSVAPTATLDPEPERRGVNYNVVSAGYFELLRIPLLQGRAFETGDDLTRPDVAIVNRTLAGRLWPGETAVGKRFTASGRGDGRTFEIVGVVADIKYRRLSEPPTPFVYLAERQWGRGDFMLHVRARTAVQDLIPALADRLRAVDPELPLTIHTLREQMAYSLTIPRIVGLVLAASSAIGLFLAATGVFAMVSYATAQRVPEIGIRIALGAGSQQVRRLVVLQGLKPTLWGLFLGVSGAVLVGRALGGLLYGVAPADTLTIVIVSGLLLVVGLLASYAPARRATAVDPLAALRSE